MVCRRKMHRKSLLVASGHTPALLSQPLNPSDNFEQQMNLASSVHFTGQDVNSAQEEADQVTFRRIFHFLRRYTAKDCLRDVRELVLCVWRFMLGWRVDSVDFALNQMPQESEQVHLS